MQIKKFSLISIICSFLLSVTVFAQSDFVFYEYAPFYSVNSYGEELLVDDNAKIYRRYIDSNYEYKTETGFLVKKRNNKYIHDSNDILYTISGQKIVEKNIVSENGNCDITIFVTENNEEVIQFIEYGVNGDLHIKYRVINEPQPTYSINLQEFPQNIQLVNDISGTEVTLPECSFVPMALEEQRNNPDNYEFKCWRLMYEGDVWFYNPGDTITIPNHDITLTPIFQRKGDLAPDTHTAVWNEESVNNGLIDSLFIHSWFLLIPVIIVSICIIIIKKVNK